MTAADDEMREEQMYQEAKLVAAISEWIMVGRAKGDSSTRTAQLIVHDLRQRGAWLPGDPVTDAMAQASARGWLLAETAPDAMEKWRAAITAALEARAKP